MRAPAAGTRAGWRTLSGVFLLLRPIRRLLTTALLLVVIVVAVANAVVLLGGRTGGGDAPAKAPHAEAALLLGAPLRSDGRLTTMLSDRVRVAARLHRDGKVSKVIASGDGDDDGGDQVAAMRDGLVRLGVPRAAIVLDREGVDTHASAVRAHDVYRVGSALVVTQSYHLPRAVWLARRAGIDAHGVSADLHGYGRSATLGKAREVLARVKAVGDAVRG